MDMGIRGWIIIVGVLLVLAVLLDGYRRIRSERRGKLRMSINMGGGFDDASSDVSNTAELPNGGARVVDRSAVDQNTDIPETESATDAGEFSPRADDNFQSYVEELLPSMSATEGDELAMTNVGLKDSFDFKEEKEASFNTDDLQELLIINVMAKDENGFDGTELVKLLNACDVHLGDMKVFQRYEEKDGGGKLQFSIANIIEPGIFDIEATPAFRTPGLCFFLHLPGPAHANVAFDCMLETAQFVAKSMAGECQDDSHSVINNQTIAHWRQRIEDYKRRAIIQHA